MTKFWDRLREQARLDDFRIHDLRHSFATEAIRQGIALPIVSKLLGHSSLAMTMRYTHASNADIEAAADRIGQSIARYLAPS